VQQNTKEHAGNNAYSRLHRQKKSDTSVGKYLFQATTMSVYQIQPTIDDRGYRTEALHLNSYLTPTMIIDGIAVVHELNVHKSHLVIIKTTLHSLFAQLTTRLSATARHIYSLMTHQRSLKYHTRQLRTAGRSYEPGNKVNDNTPDKDLKAFLNSKKKGERHLSSL